MKIFLAGATGFIGQALVRHLHNEGHAVTVLVRNPHRAQGLPQGVTTVEGDPTRPGSWQQRAGEAEVLINLTGASILTRWSEAAKKLIMDSRLLSTRNMVAAINQAAEPPQTLISASAAGYYGFTEGETAKTEQDPPGDDFLAQVCVAWETEAQAAAKGARVVLVRLPVVLGPGGGALSKMLPAFRLGLGGRLGDGRQGFPWAHIADLMAIFSFLLAHPEISGPVNCGAPQVISNAQFSKALGRALHRPAILPAPAWLLRLVMGEASAMLLKGTRFTPALLTSRGFQFRYPDIDQALADIVNQ